MLVSQSPQRFCLSILALALVCPSFFSFSLFLPPNLDLTIFLNALPSICSFIPPNPYQSPAIMLVYQDLIPGIFLLLWDPLLDCYDCSHDDSIPTAVINWRRQNHFRSDCLTSKRLREAALELIGFNDYGASNSTGHWCSPFFSLSPHQTRFYGLKMLILASMVAVGVLIFLFLFLLRLLTPYIQVLFYFSVSFSSSSSYFQLGDFLFAGFCNLSIHLCWELLWISSYMPWATPLN
jgi:hypothetical protein